MKIYQIKNSKNQFLNVDSKNPFYTDVFWRASYFSKSSVAQQIINQSGVPGLEFSETSEQAFTEAVATTTTNVSIQMDSLANKLEGIAYKLPTMKGLNPSLKNFLFNTSKKLKEMNPQFKEFEAIKEDSTYDVLGIYDDYISEIAPLEFWEMNDIKNIVIAYRKDKPSIMGMANKINKLKK